MFLLLAGIANDNTITRDIETADLTKDLLKKFVKAETRLVRNLSFITDDVDYGTTTNIPVLPLYKPAQSERKSSQGGSETRKERKEQERDKSHNKEDSTTDGCLLWTGGGDMPMSDALDHLCKGFLRKGRKFNKGKDCKRKHFDVNSLASTQRNIMDVHLAATDGLSYTSSVKASTPSKPKKPKTEVVAPGVVEAKDDGEEDPK